MKSKSSQKYHFASIVLPLVLILLTKTTYANHSAWDLEGLCDLYAPYDINFGVKALGMGKAYIAVNDKTECLGYNPAGLQLDDRITVVPAFSFRQINLLINNPFKKFGIILGANSNGNSSTVGDVMGFEIESKPYAGYGCINSNLYYSTYNLGFYGHILNNLNCGGKLFVERSKYDKSFGAEGWSPPEPENTGRAYEDSELLGSGLGANFGLLLNLNENINLGISYTASRTINFYKRYATARYEILSSTAPGPLPPPITEELTEANVGKINLPANIGVGISYHSANQFIVAFDLVYENWSKTKYYLYQEQINVKFADRIMARLGTEIPITKGLRLRMGINNSPDSVLDVEWNQSQPKYIQNNYICPSFGIGMDLFGKVEVNISSSLVHFFNLATGEITWDSDEIFSRTSGNVEVRF